MDDRKTLEYQWEYGTEDIALEVNAYRYGNRLYIGMYSQDEGVWEPFSDLTVNLPGYPVKANEAFIDDFCSADKLEFIEKHRLGKRLPEVGYSGYCTYAKVAFDLERLAEFDKEGVERFRRLHGAKEQEPKEKNKGKSKVGAER